MMDVDTNYFNADFARRLMPKKKILTEEIEERIKSAAKDGYRFVKYSAFSIQEEKHIKKYFEALGFEVEKIKDGFFQQSSTFMFKW